MFVLALVLIIAGLFITFWAFAARVVNRTALVAADEAKSDAVAQRVADRVNYWWM